MKWTEKIEQEAHHLAEILTEKQWDSIRAIAEVLAYKPTQEEKEAWEKQKQEQKERALAGRKEAYISIREWGKDRLKNFAIPARYDLGSLELVDLMRRMTPTEIVDKNLIWEGLCLMYDYGFKRGMACQKKHMKKKVTP